MSPGLEGTYKQQTDRKAGAMHQCCRKAWTAAGLVKSEWGFLIKPCRRQESQRAAAFQCCQISAVRPPR